MTQKPFASCISDGSAVAMCQDSFHLDYCWCDLQLLSHAINYGWVIYCYHPFIFGHLSLLRWNILHFPFRDDGDENGDALSSIRCTKFHKFHNFVFFFCEIASKHLISNWFVFNSIKLNYDNIQHSQHRNWLCQIRLQMSKAQHRYRYQFHLTTSKPMDKGILVLCDWKPYSAAFNEFIDIFSLCWIPDINSSIKWNLL